MSIKLSFVLLLALTALSRPVASDAKPEMCLCDFVAPRYSPIARAAVIQGSVVVKVKVHADGEISEIWPPGTVITSTGDIAQAPLSANDNYFAGASVAAIKKWRFCPGPADREIDVVFVYKLTEPGRDGWAPTEVSFHSPAVVEISTARNSDVDLGTK